MEEEVRREIPEKEEVPGPEELIPVSGEDVYVHDSERHEKKHRSDDVMLTQCIFCLVLVLAVFGLSWIHAGFQEKLLTLYEQKVSAPPEPFLARLIEAAEQWLRR
ncbi:MAG: hypothetical protein IJ496_05115 [Ruminococcus sp.]|nr:hypothetical protein [Ruminococcus sp.]